MQVEIDVSIVHETDDAYLLNSGFGDEWVPKKLVDDIDWQTERSAVITLDESIAVKKGLV